jgi:DNA-directed RNA polymerase subunit RPC12/RpoP
MEINENFSIPCPECGGTDFEVPEPLEDDSFIKCAQCGFEVLLADIKEHGLEKAREHVTDQIQKQLKKEFGKLFK